MTDFNKPVKEDLFNKVLIFIRDNFNALAKQDLSEASSLPAGAKHFSKANSRWEEWDGRAWQPMAIVYNITAQNATKLANKLPADFVQVTQVSASTANASTTDVASSAAVKQINDALTNHKNAADPHSQYMTPTEGDVRYYTKSQADSRYVETKSLATTHYTKAQSNDRYLTPSSGDQRYYTKAASHSRYYSRGQSDARYYSRGQSDARYYSRGQSDARYYTKTEIGNSYYSRSQSDVRYYTRAQVDWRVQVGIKAWYAAGSRGSNNSK